MKKIFLLLGISGLALTACNNAPSGEGLTIMSPTGAPTLALYNHVSELTTNSKPTNVAAQLLQDNFDFVVFDFYNGLKSLKVNSGHYKLARILTAGNLYLVGLGHSEEPSSDSYIVSFGENLLPDLAFKELYGNIVDDYVPGGVDDIAGVLTSRLYSGNPVDYVVIAEPKLTATLANMPEEEKADITKFSIREKWAQVKGEGAIIPQAGLFMNMNRYDNNKVAYDTFLSNLNTEIVDGISDPTKIKTAFESVGDVEAQKAKFGVPAQMAYAVTRNNNGIGLVDTYNKSVINTFLSSIGKSSEDYSAYIF